MVIMLFVIPVQTAINYIQARHCFR